MPFEDDDDDKYIISAPKSPGAVDSHLNVLLDFAKKNGLTPGSTTQGTHNVGSRHYSGNALDIKGSGAFSDAYVAQLSKLASEAGLILRDERRRPAGQAVWGGPHIHLEHAPSQSDDDKYIIGAAPQTSSTPQDPSAQQDDDSKYVIGAPQSAPSTTPQWQGTGDIGSGVTNYDQDKLARDIEWHFGYSVLAAMPKLPHDKQQQIAQLATQYAADDAVKKKQGQAVTLSPAWQLLNQQKVGVVEGKDIEARTAPDVDAAQRRAFSAGANPLLRLPKSARVVAETLAQGGAGIGKFIAGAEELATKPAFSIMGDYGIPGLKGRAQKDIAFLRQHAADMDAMSAEAQDVKPLTKATNLVKGVVAGFIEYAPLTLLPEAGVESLFARLGVAGAEFGAYSGTQSIGAGKSGAEVAKDTATGFGMGSLLGAFKPLEKAPGMRQLVARTVGKLVIVGGGTTLINRATGQPWEDSAIQGLVMTGLSAFPDLVGKIKVQDAGGERPATMREIKGLLGPAKFDIETARPEVTSPQTVYRPGAQSGSTVQTEAGQGELFTATRPGEVAGRSEPAGEAPAPLTIDQFSKSLALDPANPETVSRYQEYVDKFKKDSTNVQQMAFTMAGPGSERVPIFSSSLESPHDALVRLTRMRTDPEVWNSLEPTDRKSIGQSIAALRSGKSPAQILDEAALSQQGPGVLRASESTAASTLKSLDDLKSDPTEWGKLNAGQKASVDAQIKTLKEQGADQVPIIPKESHTEPIEEAPPEPKFAGQEGSASLNAISGNALGTLDKLRQTAVTMVQRSGVVANIKATRDAVDVKSDNYAVTRSNDVAQPLERLVGKKDLKVAQDALTPLIESKVKSFAEQRAVLNDPASKAAPGWKKRMLAAIDYAEANQARLRPLADEYSRILEEQRVAENDNGIPTQKFEGYVPRKVDYESGDDIGFLDTGVNAGAGKAFTKVRAHQTMADLIASGQNPKSIDAVGLMTDRIARGQRAINQRLWTNDLKTTVDPKTNTPVAQDPVTISKADGSTYQAAPAGYTLVDGLAVRRGYQSIYTDLVNPNWLSDSMAWRAYRATNAFGKSLILAVDTYHLGRMAVAESVLKGVGGLKPGETVRVPLPSYQRGLSILNFSAKEIGEQVSRGEISQEYADGLLNSKRIAQLYLDGGLNIGKVADNFHNTLIHSIPVLRNINHFIFNSFQRGAMMEVAELEFNRLKQARPEMSDADVVAQTKTGLNSIFGSLGRQGVFTSQWAQDVARGIFLAPQWREGLIRRELGAVKDVGQFAVDSAQGKRPYLGARGRLVGSTAVGIFIGNQIINLATRGYPTWNNPEGEWGSKISAWIPDFIGHGNGFFLNPMGIAAESFHAVNKYYNDAQGTKTEKAYDAAAKYTRTGLSYGVRPWTQLITGRDDMGRLINPKDRASEFAAEVVPQPIQGGAVVSAIKNARTGKDEQQFPGQYQSQLMASTLGLKTERVPEGGVQIRKLASLFNSANGVSKQGEFYESPYLPVIKDPSYENMQELLKSHTKDQIRNYFDKLPDKPLSGSAARETKFKATLTPAQRQQYEEYHQARVATRNAVRKVLSEIH